MYAKKRLLSALLIVGLGVMAIGAVGSAAWFTDEATLNVTGTAGQIDFKLSGDVTGKSPSITLNNLLPGVWTPQLEVSVYNQVPDTTTAVKYRFVSQPDTETVAGFFNSINVKVFHTFCGTINPPGWPVVYNGTLNGLLVDSTVDAISPTLALNDTHCYYLSFSLDPSTGNAYQGAVATFDIDYTATQPENPGWSQ